MASNENQGQALIPPNASSSSATLSVTEGKKWKLTLLEQNLVVGLGEGKSPVWFVRHGNENREQLETLIAAHNSTLSVTEAHPKEEQSVSANVHVEHYFPKGYDPDAEPWKSISRYCAALLRKKEASSEPVKLSSGQNELKPSNEAVEAAKEIHPEYSDEWFNGILEGNRSAYKHLHAEASAKRQRFATIIQSAITKACAERDAALKDLAESHVDIRWNKRAEISVSEDTKRLDWLEKNGSLEHIYEEGRPLYTKPVIAVPLMAFDFDEERDTIRKAIDAAMARDDVDRRDSSGAGNATTVSQIPLVEDKEGEKEHRALP